MEPSLNIPVDLEAVSYSTWPDDAVHDSKEIAKVLPEVIKPSTVVVNLPERVTAKEAKSLMKDLRYEIAIDQPSVVLDLSDVKEMDSAGLDLILTCISETIRRDGTIRVRGISPEAQTILELTGLDQVLHLIPETGATELITVPLAEIVHAPELDLASAA
jgi:anti-anti-sigma factor